jgi:Ca2+-binding EF-hand superfamily protein
MLHYLELQTMLKLVSLAAALLVAVPAFAAPDAQPTQNKPTRTTKGIMRYDTNNDGMVDRAEWNAGQEARFRQLDTNNDGKLSQDELFARAPASGRNVVPTEGQLRRRAAYFERLDSNRDGFVSREEFMALADSNFSRCDLNKDDRTDTAECRQALRRNSGQPANAGR